MSLVEHLEKLRHFHKLANYKSINEGAQAMGISQAGLSKSIASLESALDTSLFVRSNEGLTLTKEGELVLQTTRKIITEAQALETSLRSLKVSSVPEQIRVGMYDSIAVYFFEELQSYLASVYPNVKLSLFVDKSSRLLELAKANQLDIAIGVNFSLKVQSGLFFPLFEDHFSFYVSPQHQNSAQDMSLLIHPEASDLNGVSNVEHIQKLFKNRLIHHVYNFETLKALAIQGVGIGVLPTQVAKPLLTKKLLCPTPMPKIKHLFGAHEIGFLVSERFMKKHAEFASDVMRLGERWSRT